MILLLDNRNGVMLDASTPRFSWAYFPNGCTDCGARLQIAKWSQLAIVWAGLGPWENAMPPPTSIGGARLPLSFPVGCRSRPACFDNGDLGSAAQNHMFVRLGARPHSS